MVDTANSVQAHYPWAKVFIELAVRAMRRVHHEFLAWDYNQKPNEQPDISKLNCGAGLALADELTVCAAISQEFLISRYSSGIWFDAAEDSDAGHRFFKLTRESEYSENPNDEEPKQKPKRADFRCVKIDDDAKEIARPTLIEAKRAIRVGTMHDGIAHGKPVIQRSRIKIDIKKLRDHCKVSTDNAFGQPRAYLLIWHVNPLEEKLEEPCKFLKELDPNLHIAQIRCVPLACQQIVTDKCLVADLKVTQWLWAALVEVLPEQI